MVSELLSRHVLLNHDKLAQGVTEISLVEDDLQVLTLVWLLAAVHTRITHRMK